MKKLFNLLLLLFCFQAHAQRPNDTFSVYFDLNIPSLNTEAKKTIDSLFYVEKIDRNVPISIIGYADFLNTDEYNLLLSRKRANSVKDYLITSGIKESHIKLLVGKGEVKTTDTLNKTNGIPKDRRVDIIIEYRRSKQKQSKDTVITMHPADKLIIPPSTADKDFDITKIPKGKTFILKNIYFPMGRHFPRPSSEAELQMLLAAMKENPNMAIQIEGHVCCISNVPDAIDLDSHQMDLSVNRARFIYEYLKARGIDASRLRYVGYGKTRPIIANEQTEEEAAINRRVEIRILNK